MPSTTGYNGSTDFLKWYKQNYGADYDEKTGLSRKAGMTDGDWDVGTILHNYYIKGQQNEAARQENIKDINARYDGMIDTAKAGFASARKTLGENKAVAQQNASITLDKLRKYLPMKQQAQGLGGLGTQSAELDAYNKYMSQMGGIASDYQGNMRAIDDSETSSIGELERYRADSLEENDSLHDSLARNYGDSADAEAKSAWKGYLQNEKNKRDEAYNMAQSILSNSTSGNLADLMNYVNALNGKVSPEQLAALRQYAQSIADRNAQAAADKQQGGYDEAYNMAVNILSNATTSSLDELNAYINGLQGKVSAEQLAALGEYAKSIASRNAQYDADKKQSGYGDAFNMAVGVLQSAITDNPEELMAYVNSLEGKVSAEQLAALRQIATNVAGANKKVDTSEDSANAKGIVEDTVIDMLATGNHDGAKEFLENNKHLIGPDTLDAYTQLVGLGDKVKIEEEQAAKDQRIIEGKEYVPYHGDNFRLVEELPQDANEIVNNDSFTKQLEKMGFYGPGDPTIPNGTTFAIERDVTGSDKEDGWDLISPLAWIVDSSSPLGVGGSLVSGALTQAGGLGSYLFGRIWYVTYYNGKWYRSESMSGKSAGQQNFENVNAELVEDLKKDSSIIDKGGVLWDYLKNYFS